MRFGDREVEMKSSSTPKSQAETIADLTARCASPNEFENFDRAFRQSLTVPKAAVLKEDKRWKRSRAKKRAKKTG
jgi:hypothetical protein